MVVTIPNFNLIKADAYIKNYDIEELNEFVKLLYLRDIQGVSISDSVFLRQQKKLLPHLETGLGPWIERIKKRTFISFQEVVGFLGTWDLTGRKFLDLSTQLITLFRNTNIEMGHF